MRLFPPGIPISKRIFDLLVTIPGLILISPLFLVITIILWFQEGKPVFFHQDRPGYQGQIFTLHKFRTMRNLRDRNGKLLSDKERLTPLGKFLRAASIDELPELFNVLIGDMSLVGPRPLLIEYLERYSPEQARRHNVLPGITGWAQVNGRNTVSWQEKFRYDVWYVDHWSLGLDLKILALTFQKVLKREGITQPGQATTQYFMGNEPSSTQSSAEKPKE